VFHHIHARLFAAAAALAASAFSAQAQTNTPATPSATLPPTIVTAAPIAGSLTRPSDEQAAEEARRNPGNVTIVPASDFRDRAGATTIKDMLLYTPGVFAEPKWGEDSRLSIRGSGIARNFHLRGVRLYQDGLSVNQADGSGDFQELDPLSFQRVEVFRGANAFALGANTLGGALNFITPTGRTAPGTTLRGEGGSFGFARGQVAHGWAEGAHDAWASFSGMTQEGYRDHSAGRAYRLNGNTGWQWADNAETRIFIAYNNIWQQIPGAVTRSQALNNPRAAATANLVGNYMRNVEATRIGTVTTIRPEEGVLLEAGGGFVNRELDHPIFQYIDQRTADVSAFGRMTLERQIAGMENRTIMGVNAASGRIRARRFNNVGGNAGPIMTANSIDRAENLDAYLENSLEVVPGVALIAGASGGKATRESEDSFLRDGNNSGSGDWSWINPRFGVLWQAAEGAQVFGNLSWTTEPPTLSDLTPLTTAGGFSLLDAQRSATLEIGSRGKRGDITWEVAAYHSRLRDEIQLQNVGPSMNQARNLDRTIHQGIEAGADWVFLRDIAAKGDGLSFRPAYTFSDFRFDDDATFKNNELPGVPRHLFRAEMRYRHPSGAWFGPTTDWVPQAYYVDNANTQKTDSYVLFGLRAGWDFENGLSAFLEARNLGDTRYISSASVAAVANANSALYEPGTGRSVFAGLQYRF
jgi:iron complex outermembrane receptor protein